MSIEDFPTQQVAEVTQEVTPFDSLTQFLEDHERTEAEILSAIEVAIKAVYLLPEEDWESAMGEIVGIGLEFGIEPDVILEMYTTLEPNVE